MANVAERFRAGLSRAADLHQVMLERADEYVRVADIFVECYRAGGKVLLFGNGGSASDAEHIAAEFVGRTMVVTRPLWAQALSSNTSVITALANDFGYANVFSRQVIALARPGDVVVGLSTSGRSENVIAALQVARSLGATTVLLTGQTTTHLDVDHLVLVPSADTARIQEAHLLLGHLWAEAVDLALAGDDAAQDH